jgi:hypothetical protein
MHPAWLLLVAAKTKSNGDRKAASEPTPGRNLVERRVIGTALFLYFP